MKRFTDITIRNLKLKDSAYEVSDPGARGLRIVVFPSGKKSFVVRYRRPDGKSAKLTLGQMPLATARKAAGDANFELQQGRDPSDAKKATKAKAAAAAADTVQAICIEYLKKAEGKLRSFEPRERTLRRLVYPAIGHRPIVQITKLDCIRLFDRIAECNGPVMADHTRAILSRIFHWHEGRHDTFVSPITRGIERHATPPHERARTRTLDDDEIRRLWAATEGPHAFGAVVRFLLLTGARWDEAARITHAEAPNGDWLLPAERNKVKRELLRPLSPQAKAILDSRPVIDRCPYFFTTDGRRAVTSSTLSKKTLDKAANVHGWVLHDLRRTARSLMSRAGVNSDHAERCLGHVLGGVRGTYDRHEYYAEKKHTYEKLAGLIERIVNLPEDNVVTLAR